MFTDKKIIAEFKSTEYGKKLYKQMNICIVIALVFLAITTAIVIMSKNDVISSFFELVSELILGIFWVVVVYFDGKKDGALKQFEIDKNK